MFGSILNSFHRRMLKSRCESSIRRSRSPATRTAAFELLEDRSTPAAVSWVGPAIGNWSFGPNWSTNLAPTAADDVSINVAGEATITVDQNAVARSLNSAETVRVTGGNSLTLGGASSIAKLVVDGGVITSAQNATANLTIVDDLEWLSGTMSGIGTTTVLKTTTMSTNGGRTLDRRSFTNAGALTWTEGGLIVAHGSQLVNSSNATFDIKLDEGNTGIYVYQPDGAAFTNYGSISKTIGFNQPLNPRTFNIDAPFYNRGSVVVENGVLELNGGGNSTVATGLTTFEARATGTTPETIGKLRFNGGEHFLGANSKVFGTGIVNPAGGTVNVGGIYDVAGTTEIAPVGAVNFNVDSTTVNAIFSGGNLGGTAQLTVSNNLKWTEGVMSGSGRTKVNGTIEMQIGGGRSIDRRTFENDGDLTWTGNTGLIMEHGAQWINDPGSTFKIELDLGNTGIYVYQPDGAAFTNYGSISKSIGLNQPLNPRIFNIDAPFYNRGSVVVENGTLTFNGTNDQTQGGAEVKASAFLQTNQPFALKGGYLSGAGTVVGNVQNTGGTVRPGSTVGNLTIQGAYTQTAGGALSIEITGASPSQYDALIVTAVATLDGTLEMVRPTGFLPTAGQSFIVTTFASRTGDFATLTGVGPFNNGVRLQKTASATNVRLDAVNSPADPPTVTLSLTGAGAQLAEAGGNKTLQLSLSATSANPVVVNLAFTGAATLGTDYIVTGLMMNGTTGAVSIAPGQTTATFSVSALDDVLDELDETLVVDIASVQNGIEIGVQQRSMTILDNDPTPVSYVVVGRDAASGNWYVAASTASGPNSANQYLGNWSSVVQWVDVMKGDFDGDGDDDLVGRDLVTGNWYVGLIGSGVMSTSVWDRWSGSSEGVYWSDVRVGDFNGDGRADIAGRWTATGQWWMSLSQGNRFQKQYLTNWTAAAGVSWADVRCGDFDGDGRDEIVGRWNEAGQWWMARWDGIQGSNHYLTNWTSLSGGVNWVDVNVGDFNGDGRDDIAGRWSQAGQWWTLSYVNGAYRNAYMCAWAPNSQVNWVDVVVGDFNGDGRSDLMGRWSLTGQLWSAMSQTSSNVFATEYWGNYPTQYTWQNVLCADFDNDGDSDLRGRRAGVWATSVSNRTTFDSSYASASSGEFWTNVQVIRMG